MRLATAVVWTVAIVVWAFVISPQAGKFMLVLLGFGGGDIIWWLATSCTNVAEQERKP
jgi:hypothetical protein